MPLTSYPFESYSWSYQGIDFAGIPITQELANQMYEDGIRFVGRYLFSIRYPQGKGITAEEAQYYLNAGIRIFLYYEVNSTDALGGYEAGYQNGLACLIECTDLSVPQGTQIYCCCDMGVTDEQASGVVMDYLSGFADALPNYNVGIYGGLNVIEEAYISFPNAYRCQAGAWGVQEFSPINVRQWLIATNNSAASDGYINIQNISIDANGYATWRNYSVDLVSADTLDNMWGDDSPTPPAPTPTTHKMPLWMYLKIM